MSRDRLPHAGRHDGMYYVMGYSGHGVQMSVHMGQCLAEAMLGQRHAYLAGASLAGDPRPLGKPGFCPSSAAGIGCRIGGIEPCARSGRNRY
ncbi:hypothetical protein [Salinicola tamaricis]|uniref:hypothetical protein n=1 Tax=Salinicola tamaricis TaxID=1771309 RepID=UPI00241424DD|nr:hypothetical protein [Salinicola tamaricis]